MGSCINYPRNIAFKQEFSSKVTPHSQNHRPHCQMWNITPLKKQKSLRDKLDEYPYWQEK